jgi:hypothetical protein
VVEGGKIYLTHTGLDKKYHVTHLDPGIGQGSEEEAGVREGGKIYLTHTRLDVEHHVTHLEPGIGRARSRRGIRWSERGGQDIPDPHRIGRGASRDPPGPRN